VTSTPSSSRSVQRSGAAYPRAVDRLISEFAALPGIGRRSAERLAFHVLKSSEESALGLAQALIDVKKSVRHCANCFHLSDGDLCPVCADPSRDHRTVLVVEQPRDLLALEATGMFKGLYHVLMGRLSPLEGIGPAELTVDRLLDRAKNPATNPGGVPVAEVILGLNPTLEGDGTALYLTDALRATGVRVSRLARGLPSGGQLEHASKAVLADAIHERRAVE
jgi:recombination protein RecR